jgi:hypothetical protein
MSHKYVCQKRDCKAYDSTRCAFKQDKRGRMKLEDEEEARRVGCRRVHYADLYARTGSYDDPD